MNTALLGLQGEQLVTLTRMERTDHTRGCRIGSLLQELVAKAREVDAAQESVVRYTGLLEPGLVGGAKSQRDNLQRELGGVARSVVVLAETCRCDSEVAGDNGGTDPVESNI